MAATTFHSVIIVFWKETAFPRWRGMDRRWKRNSVSPVSSVTTVMRRQISETVRVRRNRTSKVSIRYRRRHSCRDQESFGRTVPSSADACIQCIKYIKYWCKIWFTSLQRFRIYRVHKTSMTDAAWPSPLTHYLENLFCSAHSHDEYLCQVSSKSLH